MVTQMNNNENKTTGQNQSEAFKQKSIGPESIPLKTFIKSFQAVVLICQKSDDKIIKKEEIDYGDEKSRKWLGKMSYWAWQNGLYVKTMALKDYKEG